MTVYLQALAHIHHGGPLVDEAATERGVDVPKHEGEESDVDDLAPQERAAMEEEAQNSVQQPPVEWG